MFIITVITSVEVSIASVEVRKDRSVLLLSHRSVDTTEHSCYHIGHWSPKQLSLTVIASVEVSLTLVEASMDKSVLLLSHTSVDTTEH
jgi:hypothetical protein